MSDARITGYARALFEIARAEGSLDEVEDELFRFARSYENSDALRSALTDDMIPASKRQAIVEDLLSSQQVRVYCWHQPQARRRNVRRPMPIPASRSAWWYRKRPAAATI